MATMQEIEELAAGLAAARDALAGTYMAHEEDAAALKKHYLPRIRKLTAAFQRSADELTKAVAASPGLFVKPRSVILHGIKAGWREGTGALSWDDDEALCKRIRKQHPKLVDVLLKVTEKPVKSSLRELSPFDLAKLHIDVESTNDMPYVKLADTEIAKIIKVLLKQAAAEEVEA